MEQRGFGAVCLRTLEMSVVRFMEEVPLKTRLIVAAAMVVSLAAPAFAADEFWVVQDSSTKKCTIVEKKPTESTMTVVSPSGTVYKTRVEAETGMKTIKTCTSM